MARRALLTLLAAALLAAGCGDDGPQDDGGVRVVATTTQAGDLARNVAGERAQVRTLLPPNADPHDYEPRPSDARAVAEAAIVVRSGGELDEWLGDLLQGAGDAVHVTLGDGLEGVEDDPHWWHDPRNAIRAVAVLRDALVEADPGGRDVYERNAAAYTREIEQLDRNIASCMERIPRERRKLVTSHDALGHYARRYGIEVLGSLIPSRSSQAQASAGEIQRLVDRIEDEGVETIFPESSLNPKLERAVAREAGVEVGDPLWADTLGPEGSTGATYVDSMVANTRALAKGFTGGETCPELG